MRFPFFIPDIYKKNVVDTGAGNFGITFSNQLPFPLIAPEIDQSVIFYPLDKPGDIRDDYPHYPHTGENPTHNAVIVPYLCTLIPWVTPG